MNTLDEIMTPHGVLVPAHLEAQAEVPVLAGMQRQGDVLVSPMRKGSIAGLVPVPLEGIAVVRGEAGGHTHLLVADGVVTFAPAPADRRSPVLGSLVVTEGASAYLIHPEHGATGIAPGTYEVSRQREQADEVRLVTD